MGVWTEVPALGVQRRAKLHREGRAVGPDHRWSWMWVGKEDGSKMHCGSGLADGENDNAIQSKWKIMSISNHKCSFVHIKNDNKEIRNKNQASARPPSPDFS